MHLQYRAGKYVKSISKADKKIFEEKILAETLFINRKKGYPSSIPHIFKDSRLSPLEENLVKTAFDGVIKHPGEKTKYKVPCTKFDRHGYTARERLVVVTTEALYLLETNKEQTKLKLKHRIALKDVSKLVVSPNNDNFLLIRTPVINKEKDKVWVISNYSFFILPKIGIDRY